jgi:hypothetical protein
MPSNTRVFKDPLSDAQHVVNLTGRMLADCIRSRGQRDLSAVVIDGHQVRLSNDGLSVVIKSLRRSHQFNALVP